MAAVMPKFFLLKYLASQSLPIYCSFSLLINKTSLKILLHFRGLINYANAGVFTPLKQPPKIKYAQFGFLLQKVIVADLRV